jgi:hypothetical protein
MFKLSGLIITLTYLLSPCAFAIVYKCDDNGKISYQDTKCDSGIETITRVQDSSAVHSNTVQPPLNNTQNSTNPNPNPSSNPSSITPNIPKPSIKPHENNNNVPVTPYVPIEAPLNNINKKEQTGISPEQIQQIVNSLPKSS